MKRRQTLFVIAMFAVCLLAGWWLGGKRPAPVQHEEKSGVTSTPVEKASAQPKAPISSHALQAEHLADLTRAARKGDADAALEIAKGRTACMKLAGRQRLYDMESSNAMADTGQQIAEKQKELVELRSACIGEPVVDFVELHDSWARAARLGSAEAKYQYAVNPYLDFAAAATQLERWRDWRDTAPRYLAEALQAADPRAALAFAVASKNDFCSPSSDDDDACAGGVMLGLVLAQDDVAAYAYYLLDQQLGDAAHAEWVNQQLQRLGTQLTPEQIDAARQRAAQLYAQVQR